MKYYCNSCKTEYKFDESMGFNPDDDRCPICGNDSPDYDLIPIPDIDNIFEEIRAERRRQDEKFGEQNHPMLGKQLKFPEMGQYPSELILVNQLKLTKERIEAGVHGWLDVLLEEVCEAFLETEPAKQRKKMIQVAAVAVAIIEYLDRGTKC